MARTTNWHPHMSLPESEWFDKVPKSVLFEIARQFAMRVADDFTAEAGFAEMVKEWEALHANGIVPQKPAKARTEEQIISKWPPAAREQRRRLVPDERHLLVHS